jgi:microcin C transport system permease protein
VHLLVNFVIVQAAPGGPVEQAIARLQGFGGQHGRWRRNRRDGRCRPQQPWPGPGADRNQKQYGFDKPMHERLWLMLKNYAQLDFGNSFFAVPRSPT